MALIEGRNPVMEALKGKRKIHEIYVNQQIKSERVNKIVARARKQGVKIKRVPPAKIEELAQTNGHQGVLAQAEEIQLYSPEEMLELANESGDPPLFVLLDHIQDPHNMGAIIRTSFAAGAHGLFFPSDRAAGVTPTVLKTSAGAAEHLPLARVTNINYTIDKLKEGGVWVAGAELGKADIYYKQDLTGPLALVVGNEGQGLKRLVKEKCDFLLKIPMNKAFNSLNVSVATGILLFDVLRQRGQD